MATKQSTVEIGNVAPCLRNDLRFTLQKHGQEVCYCVEDPLNSKFYRIGIPEYAFLSLLDGTTTIQDAVRHTAQYLGAEAFNEREAAAMCKWAIDNQLAYTGASSQVDRLFDVARKNAVQQRLQWINPLLIRVPVLKPDKLVTGLTRRLGWMVSGFAFAVWLTIGIFALFQLLINWSEFTSASVGALSPGNRWWLLATWIALKVVHETAHGVTCKRYGGKVREAGFLFIVFAPIPYVDVTSSWQFPSKWQRIFTAAAGMYAELFCAACAAIIWCHYDHVFVRQIAYNVMLAATFMTLLFNANPLMRFDGYYILSDLLEIPNLYPLGQQFTRHLAGRFFLGTKSKLPKWPASKSAIIKVYGLLAFLWRLFVCASIAIAASTLFAGLGIVLAIVSVALWLGFPLVKLVKHFSAQDSIQKPRPLRFAGTLLATATALFLLLMLPEPGGVRAPAVVRFAPLHVIRAPHAGFVEAISVRGGETVRPGQPIVRIENYELERESDDLRIVIEQSKLRTRLYRDRQEMAAVQAEAETRRAQQEEYDQRQAQLARAKLTAPAAGTILSPNVHLLSGRYVQEGEELLTIGEESNKELELSIAQENVDFFRQFVGKTVLVTLRSPGIDAMRCHLARIDPRGSRAIAHNALSAASGGPITVQPVQASENNVESAADWEFTEPRFAGIVKLTSAQSLRLKAGQTATARVLSQRGTLGQFFYRTIAKWLRHRFERAIS